MRSEHHFLITEHTFFCSTHGTHTQTHQAHNKPQKAVHSRNIKTTPRSQCKATRNRKQKQSPPKPVWPRNKTKYTSISKFWLKRNINRNQIVSNEDSTCQNRWITLKVRKLHSLKCLYEHKWENKSAWIKWMQEENQAQRRHRSEIIKLDWRWE